MTASLLVAQSGGPTAVINSSISGVIQEAMRQHKIDGIYGALHGILGVLREELVDLREEDPLSIWKLRKTPSAALGSCRYRLRDDDLVRIMKVLTVHNVGYFIYAGGNDSMDTAHKIALLAQETKYDLNVIGVPKTVDNDLLVTDHCPGYGSVARFNAMSTRDSGLDTEAIYTSDTVKIIETMGRDTGWIAASTALARENENEAPHLIYVPERPFIAEKFLDDVQSVYGRLGRVVVCVAEGLRDDKGEFLSASKTALDTDAFGHEQHGGVGDCLVNLVSSKLNIKARYDKPGTIQRVFGLCVSKVDLEEAYRVGQFAVTEAIEGESDKMITLVRKEGKEYGCETGVVNLDKVALGRKEVPSSFINRESNYVTPEFIEYARPLIGGPLPEYARLRKKMVDKRMPEYR